MRRSSGRGQTEPVAALVAVVVVALALATYAGAFAANLPGPIDRNHAQTAADRVERGVTVGGVVKADRLPAAVERGPAGYSVNATLTVGNRTTAAAGPTPPETADTASRRVSVHTGSSTVVPGRLEVSVWT